MNTEKSVGSLRTARGFSLSSRLAKIVRTSPWAWLGGLVGLAVTALILIPVVLVLLSSFSAPVRGFIGNYTFANLRYIFTGQDLHLLLNTVVFTIGSSVIAIVIATVLAWIATATNVPWRRFISLIPLAPLLMPPLMRDTAWVALYNPRDGLANIAVQKTLGVTGAPFNIYTLYGMTIDLGLNLVPLAYIVIMPALRSVNRSLDEASRIAGAGTARTLWKITIPIVKPAVLSALALAALVAASSFETPLIIGAPGGVGTYMFAIYRSLSGSGLANYNIASAQADVYFVLNGALLFWYLRATRKENRFQTVSGRSYQRSGGFSRWRWVLLIPPLLYFLIGFLQLIVDGVMTSFLPYFTTTQGFPFKNFTLKNYAALFHQANLRQAILNSCYVSAVAAVITVAIAVLLATVAFNGRFRGRRLVELIGTMPLAIPPLVFAVALLITVLITPGLRQYYGTLVPLVVVDLVVFLPFALRVVSSSVLQIAPELKEAAAVAGAGLVRRLATITIPLIGIAACGALFVVFVLSFRELAGVALLVGPNTPLVPTTALDLWTVGDAPAVAALNTIMILIPAVLAIPIAAIVFGLRRLRTRRQEKRGLSLSATRAIAESPVTATAVG